MSTVFYSDAFYSCTGSTSWSTPRHTPLGGAKALACRRRMRVYSHSFRLGAFVNDVDALNDVVGREDPDEIAGPDYSNEIGWHAILPAR